jgi:hypothetical protein
LGSLLAKGFDQAFGVLWHDLEFSDVWEWRPTKVLNLSDLWHKDGAGLTANSGQFAPSKVLCAPEVLAA